MSNETTTVPGEFKIPQERIIHGTPDQVWQAVTHPGGWLWPMEYEPREGGVGAFGSTITTWDPPRHLVIHLDGENGWYNRLENQIEDLGDGTSYLRYTHSGVFTDDWDNQYDGANKHTSFYLHTLDQYVQHFGGREVTYLTGEAGESSKGADAFDRFKDALGVARDATEGSRVTAVIPGVGELDALLDYNNPYFLGLRTDDAMYRFFGRNHFGHTVGFSHHLFGEVADQEASQNAWITWLTGIYA